MNKNIEIKITDAFIHCILSNDIDNNVAMELRHALKDLYHEHKKMVVIDLTNVDYVSSMGFGVLLAEYKRKNTNIRIILPKTNFNVYDIADKLNLKSFFQIIEKIEDI